MKPTVCTRRKSTTCRRWFLVGAFLLVAHNSCGGFSSIRSFSRRPLSHTLPSLVTRSKNKVLYPTNYFHSTPRDRESEEDTDLWSSLLRNKTARPLGLLLLSQFLLFIGVGAVIPTIPLYGKEIGLSQAANGVVISAPAVMLLLGANLAGRFADRARKPAMMYGMALIAAADIGTALSSSLGMLVVARLGLGASRCVSEVGERGMLADLASNIPELRGRALAAQQAMVALGIAIGAPLGGRIVDLYGPRASFLCVSAAAVLALVLYGFLPETLQTASAAVSTRSPHQQDGTASVEAAMLGPAEAVDIELDTAVESGDWTRLLSYNKWRGLALCQSGASFGFAAKIASIPILATATLPGGATGAGALLSAAGLSGLVGAPFGGWLTDRAGAGFSAIVSGVISSAGLCLIPLVLHAPAEAFESIPQVAGMQGQALVFAGLVLLWSLGAAAQGPATTALAQEMAPAGAQATALALPRAAGDGTYIVAPFLLGTVADMAAASSTPGAECAVAGVATLLGAVALGVLGGMDDNQNDGDSSVNLQYSSVERKEAIRQ